MIIPHFTTKAERLIWLKANKDLVLQAKRATPKHADAVFGVNIASAVKADREGDIIKELGGAAAPAVNGIMYAKCVINTTGLLDNHMDVHIPGIWKKSLAEAKLLYHLQEHKMQFDKVISDEVTGYTKSLSWKSLGLDYPGNTQALIFDSTIKEPRNPFMFDQYSNGYVKNHSVGMQYVRLFTCVNSEEKYWAEEKANWDKYYPQIVNQDDADELGMFWAVTEAKVLEGSAVLLGSNCATPTIEINSDAGKNTTSEQIEAAPEQSTQPAKKGRFASIGARIR
jgi:hypothetical protein